MTSSLNHSTGRCTRGFSWPHPALDLARAPLGRPEPRRAGAPPARIGLRRGRRRRAAAPGPVRRRPDRRAGRRHAIALRRREAMAILVSLTNAGDAPVERARPRRRPRRQSQLRQDRAVQRADRQPPEGRQLRRRHRRAEGRAGSPRRPGAPSELSTCPAPIRCAPAAPTRRSRATRCWAGCRRARARPARLRRRRHQPAPGAAAGAGAEAGRPAGRAGAQHVRHRRASAASRSTSRACRAELGVPVVHRRSRCAAAAPTSCWPRSTRCSTRPPAAAPATGASPTPARCAPPSARPTASCARRSQTPERPDTLHGAVDAVLLHPVAGLVILLALLFVMFQAVFTWAQAADGPDRGRLRLARRAGRPRRCPTAAAQLPQATA